MKKSKKEVCSKKADSEVAKRMAELILSIKSLPGDKIVTMTNFEKGTSWQYDIQDDGTIGYDNSYAALFSAQLLGAMHSGGSLVIRQFTDIIIDGIPIKKLYGVALGKDDYFPISAMEMECAHCTDYKTGKIIPKEKNVVFGSLSVKEN